MKIINGSFIATLLLCSTAHAGIGRIDNRQYVDWNQSPYNKVVHFMGKCTGQYVAQNIILTNAHCVYNACYDSEFDMPECRFVNSSGIQGTGHVIATGRPYTLGSGKSFTDETYTPNIDWALIKTDTLSDAAFNVKPDIMLGTFDSVGFGAMRIISDEELPIIRKKYIAFIKSKLNQPQISDKKILDKTKLATNMWADFDSMLTSADDATGVAIQPLFPADESDKLKLHKDCNVIKIKSGYFYHDCDTFHGNSGGAIFRGDDLYGITAGGQDKFNTREGESFGVDSAAFYDHIKNIENQ